MPNGTGTGTAPDWRLLTVQQLDHVTKHHLSVKVKDGIVALNYVCECGDPACPLPHTTVAFYVCPKPPCPPGTLS